MNLAWLKARRWLSGRKMPDGPFADLIRADLPQTSTSFAATEFVSLDMETTGLDAARADMLSVGWVVIRGGKVDLGTAESCLVRPSAGVGKSAAVHGLTDTAVGGGMSWEAALDEVVRVLTGRILLVHHAGLDKVLLDRMCVRRFGARLLVPVVDTLVLEHRRRHRNHHVESSASLRLSDLRDSYGLPRYAAHDCLVDAIATAELLMAIASHRSLRSLGDLIG
jgi:DNA polymerase-3 subunit epsilon